MNTFSKKTPCNCGAERVIYAPEDCWLVGFHVRPDQKIERDQTLFEFTRYSERGRIETIKSTDRGVVRPIDGVTIFTESYDKPLYVYVKKGTPLFRISLAETGYDTGTAKTLSPRPTTVMARRYRRLMGFSL